MLFWHAVIKPSPRLTAYRLFTADFHFPDSLSPPKKQSLRLPHLCHPAWLSVFISLPHSPLPLSFQPPTHPTPDCLAHPSVKVLTQLIPATAYYHGMLSCDGFLFSAAQIHLFYHRSFWSIYSGLGGGSRRLAGAF